MEQENTITSVTFFYPSRILGGAEILFIRLAKILAVEKKIKVYYVDYLDGYAKQKLAAIDEIEFIEFRLHKKITNLGEGTTLITPLSSVLDISTYISKTNLKILLWSIHPVGLESFLLSMFKKLRLAAFNPDFKEIGKDLDFFASKHGLCFMDGPNFSYQKRVFQFKQNSPQYLPILCSNAELKKEYFDTCHVIKLGWLGRLSEEKVHPLINILSYCNQFLDGKMTAKIDFHIIGKGNFDFMVNKFENHQNLNIIRQEELSGKGLNQYLVENIDLLFAMGTSALEGASIGIGTILVDFSYQRINTGNKFRWVYESLDYSVGDLYDDDNGQIHTFDELMNELATGEIIRHSEMCFNYFMQNHSPQVVSNILIKKILKTELNHSDLLLSVFKKYFWINAVRKKFHYFKYICKRF